MLTQPRTAGFLDYGKRSFTPVGNVSPDAQSYDAALQRWLPVPWYDIAPDGSRYAYTRTTDLGARTTGSEVHVVDSRADRVVWVGPGLADLYGMDSESVYFRVIAQRYPVTFRVPSAGGGPTPVNGGGVVGPDGALWGRDSAQQLVRYDAHTGIRTIWWSPGDISGSDFDSVVTFDSGNHPVILTPGYKWGAQLSLLTAPHHITILADGTGPGAPSPTSAVGDSNGIWIGRDDGSVALWTSNRGLTEILPPLPGGRSAAMIMGRCV